MKTSAAGCEFLFYWEVDPQDRNKQVFAAYLDTIAVPHVWTIGVGHTNAAGPPHVGAGDTMTRQEVLDTLAADLARIEPIVNKRLGDVPQNVFDAAVSFEYNTGGLYDENGAPYASWVDLYKSDRLDEAEAHFKQWDRAGGQRIKGLDNRRAAEWAIIADNNYHEGRD